MKTETTNPAATSASTKFDFKYPVTDVQTALSARKPEELNDADYMILDIHKHVTVRADAIAFGVELTLEMICGPVFWNALSPGDQKYSGKCMKTLVEAKMVPFAIVKDRKHEYPVLYERHTH